MGEQATGERRRVSGARPLFNEEDVPELLGRLENIIRGGRLIFGENTREFEESFRRYVGARHAVTVNSCTTALEIAAALEPPLVLGCSASVPDMVRDRSRLPPGNGRARKKERDG